MARPSAAAGTLFALVDCNNFYVSCERVFAPKLAGRPVIVLSNNDGCAVARSIEAKALGIKMGTPWFQLRDLARQHGIIALSSNYTLYGSMSNRVMQILRDFSPQSEVYSIDEIFLNLDGLDGLWNSRSEMGQAMRLRIAQWTGLPVCVGIAPSKTLAKLANHAAKKRPAFNAVCDFSTMSTSELTALLDTIEVSDVWGVGRRIGDRLKTLGIHTAKDLRDAPPKWLRSHFGVVMERTGNEMRGISCLALEETTPPKKQIICSRSFGGMVSTRDELAAAVSSFMTRAAEKLRGQDSTCNAIHVFVMTNPHRTREPQYSNGITIPLTTATDDTRSLVRAALFGLDQIFKADYWYKKAGVMAMEIGPRSVNQGELFSGQKGGERAQKLMAVLDGVNRRFGQDSLQLGSNALQAKWRMRADNRSPRYTTRWDEMPTVWAQ